MAEPRNEQDAQRVIDALAELFDAVPPGNRGEAEEELRSAGVDPAAVGQRIERRAVGALAEPRSTSRPSVVRGPDPASADSGLTRHASGGHPGRQHGWLIRRRVVLSTAAVLTLCLAGWLIAERVEQTSAPQERAFTSAREDDVSARPLGHVPGAARKQPRPGGRVEPSPAAPREAVEEPVPQKVQRSAAPAAKPASQLAPQISVPTGNVVTTESLADYEALMSPGVQWAVRRGMRLRSVETRPIRPPRAYREATAQYSGNVRLAADGMSLENYVAGLPFPHIDPNDPQVALKIMWNYEHRFMATDDFEARGFVVESGTPGTGDEGMALERRFRFDDFRRVYYTGRVYRDPRPRLADAEGVRFREFLPRILEPPGEYQGTTGMSVRHSNANMGDDTWLYVPSLRRVRRMPTAGRSDSLFGQDADVDSFFGFNGSIATMDWKFLGERTVLACMHARNDPVKWGQGSADFAFDDDWEPRSVYVVEGTSKTEWYAYSKRVLYIDKEAWVVPYSDIYDLNGQLWKVWINMFSVRSQPDADPSLSEEIVLFSPAAVMINVALPHVTRISFPGDSETTPSGWFVNQGLSGDSFTIDTIIRAAH